MFFRIFPITVPLMVMIVTIFPMVGNYQGKTNEISGSNCDNPSRLLYNYPATNNAGILPFLRNDISS
jgi:hypothetical protein